MKKIVSILLVLVMVLSFAACSKAPVAEFKILDTDGTLLYEFEAEITEGEHVFAVNLVLAVETVFPDEQVGQ